VGERKGNESFLTTRAMPSKNGFSRNEEELQGLTGTRKARGKSRGRREDGIALLYGIRGVWEWEKGKREKSSKKSWAIDPLEFEKNKTVREGHGLVKKTDPEILQQGGKKQDIASREVEGYKFIQRLKSHTQKTGRLTRDR